ncbi:MAG: PAC2 family protein [Nanoarchaeota archaeon]|nr:PAC2 family protein [Nanoarchaeota archaeon]MBU1269055.1 PAC2 family protein [Nanoarchaeota archaeon]MBU1604950.1 PAC2 family protein [Nanoarchaeota archaeon]MBU2443320.1 PAC2 family protein [Nanoarchaeota archaeon]
MTDWKITQTKKVNFSRPILIEGLPGIGNVGKIVADIMVEELDAKKIMDFFSYSLPNSVFVNEDNLVELPKIEMYHKKVKGKDFLFLTGDVQPMDEVSSYKFTEKILDISQKNKCREIITLGGIGIEEIPENPKVYCTGNDGKFVEEFKNYKVKTDIYGVVGPIIGVSGLLLGLSKRRNMKAASLLAETYGHPMYIGIKGAKEIIKVLNKRYEFGISLRSINSEIRKLNEESGEGSKSSKKHTTLNQLKHYKDMSYIG